MKLRSVLLLLLVVFLFASCKEKEQRAVTESKATFFVDDISHVFEEELTIEQEYSCEFTYFNTGKTPLVINDVKTSCSCITAGYPKEPLAPGQSAVISVKYKADVSGYFRRSITVYSNTERGWNLLWLKGTVKE